MRTSILRTTVAAGVGLSLVLAGAATAAPAKQAPVCNMLEDPTNDTFVIRQQDTAGQYGPQEDALDVVSADIGTNATTLTGAIRVRKLAKTIATGAGQSYELQFRIPASENVVYVSATIRNGAETFGVGFRDATTNTATSLGTATGVFDLAKNEVRISAPIAAFTGAGGIKKGSLISDLFLTSSRNVVAANVFADVAEGAKSYKAGAPTCVPVGK